MYWLNWFVGYFNDLTDFFYDLYIEVLGWVWPFWLVADRFWGIAKTCNNIAWAFSHFGSWVLDVADKITSFFTEFDLEQWFTEWKEKILDAWGWVSNAWNNIWNEIVDWWETIKPTVQGWIDIAVQGFEDLIEAWDTFWNVTWPEWTGKISELRSLWDNFWTIIFPTLVSFTWLGIWWDSRVGDIQGLIDSAFFLRDSLWAGWQDLRDSVTEFFADPLQWLYNKMDEFFERFW